MPPICSLLNETFHHVVRVVITNAAEPAGQRTISDDGNAIALAISQEILFNPPVDEIVANLIRHDGVPV